MFVREGGKKEREKGRESGELLLDLALLKVRGTLMLQGEKVP